jgi:queuine tRNA-ribosyltransferase
MNLLNGRFREDRATLLDGCPCPACAGGRSRAYLRHLVKQREPAGLRLLTLHNLTFVAAVMTTLRNAILAGRLAETAASLHAGALPFADRPA